MAKAKQPCQESTLTQQEEVAFRAAEDASFAFQPSYTFVPSSSSRLEAFLATIMDQLHLMCVDLVVFLTIFLMRCVRWALVLVISLANSLASVASSLLPRLILLWSPPIGDDDGYYAFGSTHDEDMTVSQWFTLCHLWQKRGSGFGYEKVVLLLGGELD